MIIQGEAMIAPRWEWRTFDASLNAIGGRIAAALEQVAPHTSAEIYLLRLGSPQDAKIPDGTLDVKRLQQVDVNGLVRLGLKATSGIPIIKERHVPSEIEHKYLVLKEAWKPSTSGVFCHPLKNAWFEFGSQEIERI